MRTEMDEMLAKVGELEDLIDQFDRAADAAMLPPAPQDQP
jgi:hypothetical protein